MTTTIKVSNEVRDRLKAQARAANRTLGEHLSHLAEAGDREARFAALEKQITAMSSEDLASYKAETEWWDKASQ